MLRRAQKACSDGDESYVARKGVLQSLRSSGQAGWHLTPRAKGGRMPARSSL